MKGYTESISFNYIKEENVMKLNKTCKKQRKKPSLKEKEKKKNEWAQKHRSELIKSVPFCDSLVLAVFALLSYWRETWHTSWEKSLTCIYRILFPRHPSPTYWLVDIFFVNTIFRSFLKAKE